MTHLTLPMGVTASLDVCVCVCVSIQKTASNDKNERLQERNKSEHIGFKGET